MIHASRYSQLHKDEARYAQFTKEKLAQQILGQELDKIDAEKKLDDRATTRKVLRDKMMRNQWFVQQWHEQGLVEWRINQDVQRRRELEEETYRQRKLFMYLVLYRRINKVEFLLRIKLFQCR